MVKKRWDIYPSPPQSFFDEFAELPASVASLLYNRNLRTQEQIDEFLNPDYSQDIHDPYLFKDMEKAVTRIFYAIEHNERIVVHGDYDADGVSASVILVSTLKALGHDNVDIFIPHREIDGYGLNKNTVNILLEEQTNLIITCDCGISNVEETTYAQDNGIDVIITDHHTIPQTLPPAYAIIHPKIDGEQYPYKDLAGGGVAFKLMQGLLNKHKETHDILVNGKTHESHEKWLLDMVAIASVADMVPLIGESRTLTKYGLIVLNKAQRIGMKKLLMEARIMETDETLKREITTDTIGFQIGPRINAAGRINHANVAFHLFMTDKGTDAVDLAYELNQNNIDRQKMTEELLEKSINIIETEKSDSPIIFVCGKNWPTGLVGLIASRLKEKYYKPSIVMAHNGDEITGSGRSIDGFNIIESFQEIPDVFKKFGGHPMACGFTLGNPDILETFKTKLQEKYYEKTKEKDMTAILHIDAEINLDEVDWELYDILNKFKPFGIANPKPHYLAHNVEVFSIQAMGKENNHMRLSLRTKKGAIKKAIGWQFCDDNNETNWCDILKPKDKINIVFDINVNEWNGNRELQLMIIDIKKA